MGSFQRRYSGLCLDNMQRGFLPWTVEQSPREFFPTIQSKFSVVEIFLFLLYQTTYNKHKSITFDLVFMHYQTFPLFLKGILLDFLIHNIQRHCWLTVVAKVPYRLFSKAGFPFCLSIPLAHSHILGFS